MRPTKRQRHAVEVAVSIGLTVEQIAAAIEIPRHSIYSHFSDELAAGRAKRLLANAVRLDLWPRPATSPPRNTCTP